MTNKFLLWQGALRGKLHMFKQWYLNGIPTVSETYGTHTGEIRDDRSSTTVRYGIGSIVSRFSLVSLICLLMLTLCVGNVWGQSCTSYNESTKDTQTSITSSNAANGSAGEVSWSGDGTCSSSQWRFAANKSVTFTVSSGYQITQIAFTSTSSSNYYGTWSSTSGSKSTSDGTTTFTGINATSVTLSTSTAARMKTCNVTYEAVGGGCSTNPSVGGSSNSSFFLYVSNLNINNFKDHFSLLF